VTKHFQNLNTNMLRKDKLCWIIVRKHN